MLQTNLHIEHEKISLICQKYHIQKLSVFGSVLYGEENPSSDSDLLLEFEPEHTPGFSFISIQDELSSVFQRPVDLHTPQSISKYFRNSVVKEAQALYESA